MRVVSGIVLCAMALRLGTAVSAADEKLDAGMSVERLRRIAPKVKEYIDADKLAGAVTLVYRHGKIVDVQAIGWQDREKKIAMKRDTIFRLASMTKPITAAAAMMLINDGKMGMLDPIDRWLPELAD